MLEERTDGKRTTDKDAEQVLLELGEPKLLAEQYRETKKYIIGPEFYDPFMTVMKITLYSVVIVMSFEFVIQIIMNPASLLEQFVDYIVSFFTMIYGDWLGNSCICIVGVCSSKWTRFEYRKELDTI